MSNDIKKLIKGHGFETWSPSALKEYNQCPRRAVLERRVKLCTSCFAGHYMKESGQLACSKCGSPPEAMGEPLRRGSVVHAAAEAFVTQRPGTKPPPKAQWREADETVYLGGHAGKLTGQGLYKAAMYDFDLTAPKVKKLLADLQKGYRERRVRVELELAFTKSWRLTKWLARDVYVRFKVDIMQLAGKMSSIKDWKTGRPKPHDYDAQLRGYAVAALSAGFGEETQSALVYTDHNLIVEEDAGKLKRADLPKAQAQLDKEAARMLADKLFVAKPSGGQCQYCPFTVNKGGPCEY